MFPSVVLSWILNFFRLQQVEILNLATNQWKNIPWTNGKYERGIALFSFENKLYRFGGARFQKSVMVLDCGVHDCENCPNCENKWEYAEGFLDIGRLQPGYTLIPENLAKCN